MLVSVTELTDYMDITFSVRQKRACRNVLAGLQSELEAHLRRPIEVGQFTEDYVLSHEAVGLPTSSFFYSATGDATQAPIEIIAPGVTVYLRNSPVSEVSSVTLTKANTTTPLPLRAGVDYTVRRFGIDLHTGWRDDVVTVSYEAGLDGEAIDIFKLLILRAATREMQNMHDDVVGLKDLETRNVAPLTTGFTPEELASVSRWRRRQVG